MEFTQTMQKLIQNNLQAKKGLPENDLLKRKLNILIQQYTCYRPISEEANPY
jgi:hypothetical protein